MLYILIFIFAWIIASVVLLRAKLSYVLSFGGGLILAAIILLLAAEIIPPDRRSDSGSSTAHYSEYSPDESLSLVKRKSLYSQAILLERQARVQAEINFPMPDVNSEEYRKPGAALSILTKQNEEQDRINNELWQNLVDEYGITQDALIEIIVEGSNSGWPKP